MKSKELERFLDAWSNRRASGLLREMMPVHYAEAVMAHYPSPERLDRESIFQKCSQLCSGIFDAVDQGARKPELLPQMLNDISRNSGGKPGLWFPEFNLAYDQYRKQGKMGLRLKDLEPWITGKSCCDVGCGSGELMVALRTNRPEIEVCDGIDVLDWRSDTAKQVTGFQQLDLSQPGTTSSRKYDCLTCFAVLHHVGEDQTGLETFLDNLRDILAPGGRLVVEEDVILPKRDWQGNPGLEEQIKQNLENQQFFGDYLALAPGDQQDLLILIDVLANVVSLGVQGMNFPFGFRTLGEWVRLFSAKGFSVRNILIYGFRPQTFNRSAHVWFIL